MNRTARRRSWAAVAIAGAVTSAGCWFGRAAIIRWFAEERHSIDSGGGVVSHEPVRFSLSAGHLTWTILMASGLVVMLVAVAGWWRNRQDPARTLRSG